MSQNGDEPMTCSSSLVTYLEDIILFFSARSKPQTTTDAYPHPSLDDMKTPLVRKLRITDLSHDRDRVIETIGNKLEMALQSPITHIHPDAGGVYVTCNNIEYYIKITFNELYGLSFYAGELEYYYDDNG